jgi:hypothetical protein
MPYGSSTEDLALHGVRVLGYAPAGRVAERYSLDAYLVEELLLDYEAMGWTRRGSFGGDSGWSLSDTGKVENERRLAEELFTAGVRDEVAKLHAEFVPLNKRFGEACTRWQVRPSRLDPIALNDHSDWRWDERVLGTLAYIGTSFREVCGQLASCLARFDGYAERYDAALRKVDNGDRRWVDGHDRDSCHLLWMQFHEDLLATLGIPRGAES